MKGTDPMTRKLDFMAAAPAAMQRWLATSMELHAGIEPRLAALVQMRSSQINGCAYCLNMHAKEARKAGETQQRLDVLAGWRDAPLFSDRERAALAWTEALTQLSGGHGGLDAAHAGLAEHFSPEEQVKLTLLVNVINGWNRLCVGFEAWADEPARRAA